MGLSLLPPLDKIFRSAGMAHRRMLATVRRGLFRVKAARDAPPVFLTRGELPYLITLACQTGAKPEWTRLNIMLPHCRAKRRLCEPAPRSVRSGSGAPMAIQPGPKTVGAEIARRNDFAAG